ncbi:MAG: undecaprenyl-phosphate glucose phosphotransferase [Phyllobacteriaceae bacterium]|nr:undecaprenyl-phosphate glucose phosphotransferase [Phyllobacteriaceae bacterium]
MRDDVKQQPKPELHDSPAAGNADTKPQIKAPPLAPETLNPLALNIARQFSHDTISPAMLTGILRAIDAGVIAACGIISYLAYVGPGPLAAFYLTIAVAGGLIGMGLLEINGAYAMKILRTPLASTGKVFTILGGAFASLAIIGFFLKISEDFSRLWFALWFATATLSVVAARVGLTVMIRRWARNGTMERRAVIVGGGQSAEELIRAIEQQPHNDIRILGLFDDRDGARSPKVVAGYPKLGSTSELINFARIARVDMLIVSLPMVAEARVMQVLKKLWVLPLDIRLSAHMSQLRFRPRSYSYIGSVPMLDIFDKPINDWDSVAKRLFDIAFSLLGILALSPVMIATAIAIKLDSKGPVFFRQKRHGFNNEVVNVLKFRSMYTEMCDPTAVKAVTKGDPRVTKVGRIIRKTSLDELPQFFNVLMGNLSLVGPRPHAVTGQTHDRLYHEVVEGYFARHRVKPGVTGWAQINGWRGEVDTDEKIKSRTEYDLYYIENWSLWFDLKILLLTPIRLLNSENAY